MCRAAAVILMTLTAASCAGVDRPQVRHSPPPPDASLWVEPTDLDARDLFYGPWGPERAPDPEAVYRSVKLKRSGVNFGMTVEDPQGRKWSVKQPFPGNLDSEGPVEVTVSRLLSAVGYHQPPIYFLPRFTLEDDWGRHVEMGGRFRLKHDTLDEQDPWDWADNPFVGSRPYQGLIVLLMMFNSTDLKNSNNSIYEHSNGAGRERWYVARDLGSALGDTQRFVPRKNNVEAFEREPFILGVSNGYVEFAYHGWYKNLVRERITPAEVAWASTLLGRLSDEQFADAFRAGGFEPDEAQRFIGKLEDKIAEGRAVAATAATAGAQAPALQSRPSGGGKPPLSSHDRSAITGSTRLARRAGR
jgi:hypothetical protein